MKVLGIETSCDETAAAVYDGQAGLLAHQLYSQVELHAECGWGNITVIVPRGWTVVVGSTTVGSGNLSNKATDPGLPGYPVLVVSGSVTAGNIKIKYSRR